MKVAPWGSVITDIRTQGASNGSAMTCPPSSFARAALASASSTAKVRFQCGGVSDWSSGITCSPATASSKPAGAPISFIPARMPGVSCSRTFRIDRLARPASTGVRFESRELPAKDAAAYVERSIASRPHRFEASVTLAVSADEIGRRLPGWWGGEARSDRRAQLHLPCRRRRPRLAGDPDRDARGRLHRRRAAGVGRACTRPGGAARASSAVAGHRT